ncbi:hypothetical protein KC887_02550 [Candidatus Kaiserbacteria bacterium]|nr:hypothetical protein [Candidatus Kaiserbacteria bacterium]
MTNYSQYEVIEVVEVDGLKKPVCKCPVCGESMTVQPQKIIRMLWLVDCVNTDCANYKHTAAIPEDDV